MRRIVGITATTCILAVLYWRVDVWALSEQLAGANLAWIAWSLGLFVPQIGVSAVRWRLLVRHAAAITVWDATRQVLAANALNLVLPSKVGDLAKGAAGASDADQLASQTGRAVFEKLLDLLALSGWAMVAAAVGQLTREHSVAVAAAVAVGVGVVMALGLVLVLPTRWIEVPSKRWAQVLAGVRQAGRECLGDLGQGTAVFASTGMLWALQLIQIDCFFRALGGTAGWTTTFLLVPGALLVGLIPGSVCGLGPRDSALVLLFAGVEPASRVAGVGLLLMLRYLVPGLVGLAFLGDLARTMTLRDFIPTRLWARFLNFTTR
jgi:hypothetical protein